MTETISFAISQDLLASLNLTSDELGRAMRLSAAIVYFNEKKLSMGKAAELAGLNRLEFMDILARRGHTVFDYDASVLDDELDGVSQLNALRDNAS